MNTYIKQIIIHHFNETASKEDEKRLQKWLQESAENQAEFEEMKKTWEETKAFFEVEESTDSKSEMAVDEEESDLEYTDGEIPNDYPKRDLYSDLFKMGVGIVLLIAMVWGFNLFLQPTKPIVSTQKIQTFQNDQRLVNLEDGSKVWLNKNSILTIPQNFEDKERQVRLFGEAFFEVVHDEKRPFTVLNKSTKIQVLGTSFNVRANEERVRVGVKNGKVDFRLRKDEAKSLVLKEGENGIFTIKTQILETTISSNSKDWEWQLRFLEKKE